MATNFPNSLDVLTNPTATSPLSNPSHSQQHINLNDAVEAIQTKIGVDGSQDTDSFDYKINTLELQVSNIGNNTETVTTLLGLEGNNDLIVSGIENKTSIDSFSKTVYRTVRYVVQITKGSEYVTNSYDFTHDSTDFHVNELEVVSNTENTLANVTFEENSGIISLYVEPVSSAVTARFYRTALKI
ncbi:hypothetical protein EB001_06060 [bacterium]|nr:hypothetical protein [bacterium]